MADVRRLVELGMVPPLAKEVASQITSGVGNARRLAELSMVPRLAGELATQITAKVGNARRLAELTMVPVLAREASDQINNEYDPSALAFFARAPSTSNLEKQSINRLIVDLKSAEIWDKTDCLYAHIISDEASSFQNIKSAQYPLTKTGTVLHTPNFGMKTDKTTSAFLGTGFIASTAGGNYALTNAEIDAVVGVPISDSTSYICGTPSGPGARLKARGSNARSEGFINVSTGIVNAPNNSGLYGGLFGILVDNSTQEKIAKNEATIVTGPLVAAALPTSQIVLGRANNQSSDEYYMLHRIGAALSDAERILFNTAISKFVAALARPIRCFGDSLTAGVIGISSITPDNYPQRLSELSGRVCVNAGISSETSTQIKTRLLAEKFFNRGTSVLWVGRNNITQQSIIMSDLAEMVAAQTTNQFLILSVINGDYPTERKNAANHTGYDQIIAINAAIAAAYPNNYFDIRSWLIANGLAALGITPTAQDIIDLADDTVPSSLRSNEVHLTDTLSNGIKGSYGLVGQKVYDFISAKGW